MSSASGAQVLKVLPTLLAGVRSEPTPYVHVWALDVDRLLEIARGRVTRSLTDAECRQYLQDLCP